MRKEKPLIGISMGDPAGIGPEIAVRALQHSSLYDVCHPLIIGDAWTIGRELEKLDPTASLNAVSSVDQCNFSGKDIQVVDLDIPECRNVKTGKVSSEAGHSAFVSVIKMIELAQSGEIDACVTGPIHKKSLNDAGYHYAGHTEIFAEYTGAKNYAMLLASEYLKIIHVTTHISLRDACDTITPELVYSRIRMLHEALLKFGYKEPRIGVAGLNPHAGDQGLFGDEDLRSIKPGIDKAIKEGYDCEGPVPPDTLFPKAHGKYYDGCVAMYHDQGHIPFKMHGFVWDDNSDTMKNVSGVNITLGLPIIRTSVDHGTAFDIAGKGLANEMAMLEAIEYAAKMSTN